MNSLTPASSTSQSRFISLRWRLLVPLFVIMLLVTMVGAYMVTSRLTASYTTSEVNVLRESMQSAQDRARERYLRLRSEAQRVAFTVGVVENLQANQPDALYPPLESLAAAADVDSIITVDVNGQEVAGVLRVDDEQMIDYSLSQETDLSDDALVQSVLGEEPSSAGVLLTPRGAMVFAGVRVTDSGRIVGAVLVGQRLDAFLSSIQASAISDLTLYSTGGSVIQTTYELDSRSLSALGIRPAVVEQTMTSEQPVIDLITISEVPYRVLYSPLILAEVQMGVLAAMMPDNTPFIDAIGQQVMGLFAAAMSGAVVVIGFIVVGRVIGRMEAVGATADALARGERLARTHMQPNDEVGSVGQALDAYADYAQAQEDKLHSALRRQRRERQYLLSVLESMPDGVIVQDKDGYIVMMNDVARTLVGTQVNLDDLSLQSAVNAVVGESASPGVYALGDPQQIQHAGRMLRAQAAAILSANEIRVGTVIILRDMTEEVQQAQFHGKLLKQLSDDVQEPLASLVQQGVQDDPAPVRQFARGISRHAAALQKMIVDMRELTQYNQAAAQKRVRPLQLERLIWAVANDWRQIAQAANHELKVMINESGLRVLGDEGRLRWAIGNFIDNAIKYTPAGGIVTLEIKTVIDEQVHLRIRDNGVGISRDDLPHLFMPFYRGTPVDSTGEMMRVPGMGQGLPLAKQVIEAHGGAIKVKTKAGVGTAVYFSLPLTSGEYYNLPRIDQARIEGETAPMPADFDLDALR